MSTPPSVTSARAKTTRRMSRPSRRMRWTGCTRLRVADRVRVPDRLAGVSGERPARRPPVQPRRQPGQIQRHETPAWSTIPAPAAPTMAPILKRAWNRTSAAGLPIRRCEASAFMAVSILPPAISTATRATTKAHRWCTALKTTSRTDHASSAIHRRRRAPTRLARWAITALGGPGHGDGQGQDQAELGIGEREGVLDVEDHDGPAAPEQAEGDEGRHHRPHSHWGPQRGGGGGPIRTCRRRRPWPRTWPRRPARASLRPAPTSPPPSRSRRAAETVKMRRRPSTLTRVASARTTLPRPTGARWSNWTRVATLVWAAVRCPSVARRRPPRTWR